MIRIKLVDPNPSSGGGERRKRNRRLGLTSNSYVSREGEHTLIDDGYPLKLKNGSSQAYADAGGKGL